MKKHLLALLTLAAVSTQALGQETKVVGSKLGDVTVFFAGAELTHSASTTLIKGENEISIEGLSPNIDANSLKIKASNSVVISSHEFSVDYMAAAKAMTPTLKRLQDSIAFYQASLDKVNTDLKINTNMMNFLSQGVSKNVSGSENGLGIDEFRKTMDYYKTKSEEMEITQIALSKRKTELTQAIQRVQTQYNQESIKGNKTSGVLKLVLSAPRAGNSDFTISYYTTAASWAPYYEINVASSDKPVTFAMKSKVRQTTGLDWEKVRLTLSTATPSNGKVAPLLSAWFLQQVAPVAPTGYYQRNNTVKMQNSYSYADMTMEEIALPQALVSGSSSRKDMPSRLIVIDGVVATENDLAMLDPSMIKSQQMLSGSQARSAYGARANGGVLVVELRSSMDDYVTSSDNELNVVYNIDLPYTIPGSGKVQNIDLQTKTAPAEYKYYSAPKLDTETYLLTEIADWSKLGLMSGKASVTYDGTFIGETHIDANSTMDKLALTLGTDERVSVKREKMQDFSSNRTMGSDMVQVFTYKITVKNNQNRTIKMVLKDQYPISTNKSITVELRTKETTQWTANKEDVGVLTWEEEFAPGETKTYQVSYSVKYPKDWNLNL